jgi:transposase InsO family protein
VYTTRRDPLATPASDLVERRFAATAPNQLWVADITAVPTAEDFLDRAVILDVFSRRVVGWSMADHLRAELVVGALEMAVWNRRPGAGVIHHSDHGCQYTSLLFGQHCQAVGIRCTGGLSRRLLRQRDGRELLRDPGVRVAGPAYLSHARRGAHRALRIHRGVLQSATAALRAGLPIARRV